MEVKVPPKEITSEDGHLYQLKKPLYTQPLFWTTLVLSIASLFFFISLIVSVLVAIGLKEESDYYREMNRSYLSYSDEFTEHDEHKIGEKVTIDDNLRIQVEQIKSDSSRKMSDESSGIPIVVRVTIENIGTSSQLVSPYSFDLYDKDWNLYLLDSSTFDQLQVGKNLEAGKSLSFDLVFDGEEGKEADYCVTYEHIIWRNGISQSSTDLAV